MRKRIIIILLLLLFSPQVFAYKEYYFDENGNKCYRVLDPKDFKRYKNAPKRSFKRVPRVNWEITDAMRARKMTSSQYTHRKF